MALFWSGEVEHCVLGVLYPQQPPDRRSYDLLFPGGFMLSTPVVFNLPRRHSHPIQAIRKRKRQGGGRRRCRNKNRNYTQQFPTTSNQQTEKKPEPPTTSRTGVATVGFGDMAPVTSQDTEWGAVTDCLGHPRQVLSLSYCKS